MPSPREPTAQSPQDQAALVFPAISLKQDCLDAGEIDLHILKGLWSLLLLEALYIQHSIRLGLVAISGVTERSSL